VVESRGPFPTRRSSDLIGAGSVGGQSDRCTVDAEVFSRGTADYRRSSHWCGGACGHSRSACYEVGSGYISETKVSQAGNYCVARSEEHTSELQSREISY